MTGIRWLLVRLHPPAQGLRPARDHALEGLRGLCAGLVLLAHLLLPYPAVDPLYAPPARLYAWLNFGLPAVLLFFVLSGYVIGLTTRRPAGAAAVEDYLRRRALRLLPVTGAAVLLAWLLQPDLSGRTVLGNLLFLQNEVPYPLTGWKIPVLPNNQVLWTLNYEAFYYVAFVVVWWSRPPLWVILSLVAGGAFGLSLGLPVPELIGRQACGAFYWMSGLAVAWLTTEAPDSGQRTSSWPSALLATAALWHLGGLRAILLDAEASSLMWLNVLSPHRLDFLPAAVWCLLAATGRAPRAQRILAGICLAWGWAAVVRTLGKGDWPDTHWPAAAALALSTLGLLRPWPVAGLAKLARLGVVSFGVYAFASPVQIALRKVWPALAGSGFSYVVRCTAIVGLTLALAWLLDYRLHAWLTARRRHGRPSP